MNQLYTQYRVDNIYFEEDIFTANRRKVFDLCNMITDQLPGRSWSAQARVGTVDLDMLATMKRSGCSMLMFGVESGSQRILDFLGKGINVNQTRLALQATHQAGIDCGLFLIVGVPGETDEDINLTKQMISDLNPQIINVSYLTPIPGTSIYGKTRHLIRKGVRFFNFNEQYESVYRQDLFRVRPKERLHDVLKFFLNEFGDKVDPRWSLGDGTALQ